MIEDMKGNKLKIGDTVRCGGLEFIIDSFDNSLSLPGDRACGEYGCFSTDLLEKVDKI